MREGDANSELALLAEHLKSGAGASYGDGVNRRDMAPGLDVLPGVGQHVRFRLAPHEAPSSLCSRVGSGSLSRVQAVEVEVAPEGNHVDEGVEGGAFDLVFLDAGKRDYARQRAMLLDHNLIRVGALVVADNVLWAGAVPLHSEALKRGDVEALAPPRDRNEKVTRALHDYVAQTAVDARWQQIILPLRDGLSVCRRVA